MAILGLGVRTSELSSSPFDGNFQRKVLNRSGRTVEPRTARRGPRFMPSAAAILLLMSRRQGRNYILMWSDHTSVQTRDMEQLVSVVRRAAYYHAQERGT
jgi:hypothetical protein